MIRKPYLLVLAVFVLVLGLTNAKGQEPIPSPQEEGRGGFISDYPSWFVKVKSSEVPLPKGSTFYQFAGSGTWIAEDLVLTCWHNWRFKRTDRISPEVCIEDHNGNVYTNVEIAAVDKSADILVVRVKGKIFPHNQARVSTEPETAGVVYSWGLNTDAVRFRWSRGEVIKHPSGKAVRQGNPDGTMHWHVHDGLVVQGMSGGPGFDESGELQCVNVGHYNGRSSSVSLSVIQRVLDTIN